MRRQKCQDLRVQLQIDSDQWEDQKIICYNHIFKFSSPAARKSTLSVF